MVKRIDTKLVRVHKEFEKECLIPLRKIMAEKRGLSEEEISFAEVSIELSRRVKRIGGFKELI